MHCNQEIQLSLKEFNEKQWRWAGIWGGGDKVERVGSNSPKKVLTIINPNRFLKVVFLQPLKILLFFSSFSHFFPELFISDNLAVFSLKENISFNFYHLCVCLVLAFMLRDAVLFRDAFFWACDVGFLPYVGVWSLGTISDVILQMKVLLWTKWTVIVQTQA